MSMHPKSNDRTSYLFVRKTPACSIREALHIKEEDTIAVELQGEEVKITPVPSTLAEAVASNSLLEAADTVCSDCSLLFTLA